MSDEESPAGGGSSAELVGVVRFGSAFNRRRRRAEAPELRRTRIVKARLSEPEYEQVLANAAAARLAVGAYVAEVALAPLVAAPSSQVSSRQRADMLVELMGMHRQLRGACTNVNQLAAAFNATDEAPAQEALAAVLAYVTKVARRVDDVVAAVTEMR